MEHGYVNRQQTLPTSTNFPTQNTKVILDYYFGCDGDSLLFWVCGAVEGSCRA